MEKSDGTPEVPQVRSSSCRLKNGFIFIVACTGLFFLFSYVKYASNGCSADIPQRQFMSTWVCTGWKYSVPSTEIPTIDRFPTGWPPSSVVVYNKTDIGKMYSQILKDYVNQLLNESHPQLVSQHCLQPSAFVSWTKGTVTEMGMPLKKDCHKLRQNPAQEMETSHLAVQLEAWKRSRPWEGFAPKIKNMGCDEMRKEFENNFYVSPTEEKFPIAYILVVYTNAGQVLRLLKSIYRAHNLYCIHPDARRGNGFKEYFTKVATCLDNVFVVSKPIDIYYGHISITDSQLLCMQDLEQYPEMRWKYVINLCGKEIPLKTNREIVDTLQQLKGYSAVGAFPLPHSFWTTRFTKKYRVDNSGKNRITNNKQAKPPRGIKLYKSMNFIAASRAFVRFILNDSFAKEFHDFLTTVYAPEEHFYSSLYSLPGVPGAQPPPQLHIPRDVTVDAFIWVISKSHKQQINTLCPGRKVVHSICILTTMELEKIERVGVRSKRNFFFNKYFLEWDPVPMDCMEERLVETNMEEYKRDCMPSIRFT